MDCHWAQSWIEASNIKHSLPVPDLQSLEAVPAGHWSLRTPPRVGLSTREAKSISGVCIICVLLALPAFGASSDSPQVPNSCHTFVRFYYNCQITGVPESSSSASEFLTPQPFVLPLILIGFLNCLFLSPVLSF